MAKAQRLAREARAKTAQLRGWHDLHGVFLHEGTYLHCNKTSVILKLDDDIFADVTIETLFTKDQEYIDDMLHANGK